MRLRPTPPALPPELVARFGPPEDVFGPNLRFRFAAAVCGLVFVLTGAVLFLMGLGAGGARLPLSDWISGKLAVPLVVLGAVVVVGTRLVPMNWVFVCSQGLVRTRGAAWQGIKWAEVDRFEDATLDHKGVTTRQCRLLLKDGTEWGFLADYVAEYRRLSEVLRRKIHERAAPPAPPRTEARAGRTVEGKPE